MRFRKGDKVEILDKKEVPVSWRIAEILSGNGRNYQVQYNPPYPGMASERLVETISSKLVRPSPPLVYGVENCVAGDIVEVFHEFSWKICTVLKILGGNKRNNSNKVHLGVAAFQNRYLVRLLGCSQELLIDQSNIRMRQTWHGDTWILMRKSSRGAEDVIVSKPLTSNYYRKLNFQVPQCNGRAKHQPQKVCVSNQDGEACRISPVISSRSLKRMSPYCTSIDEACGRDQKLRAIQKDVGEQRLFASPVLEKGHSWRHSSCVSKGLKLMPGFATIPLTLTFGRYSCLLSNRCNLWPFPGITHSLICIFYLSSGNWIYLHFFCWKNKYS